MFLIISYLGKTINFKQVKILLFLDKLYYVCMEVIRVRNKFNEN